MDTLNLYFDKIVFFKVDRKEDFAIYAAAITSSFGDGRKQYVLAFVPTHLAILNKAYITNLHWRSLQTRVLANGYKIPQQKWSIPRGLQMPMFIMVDRNDSRTKYTSEDDRTIEMVLLHDVKKKSIYQYGAKINIIAALTSFRCVINLIDVVAKTLPPHQRPIQALATRMPTPELAYRPPEEPVYSSGNGTGSGACTTKYCMYNAGLSTEEGNTQLAQPFQSASGNGSYRQLPTTYASTSK